MKSLRLERWLAQAQTQSLRESRSPYNQATRSLSYFLSRSAFPPSSSQCQCHGQNARQLSRSKRQVADRPRQVSTATDSATNEHLDQAVVNSSETLLNASPISRYTPPVNKIATSAKLAAIHARLALPAKLPLRTLARCLIDPTADPRPTANNASLAMLGQDLLGTYTAEYLLCKYPRLPMPVVFTAQYAYAGSATLASIRAEWGVEAVAAPGPEVDPGLLQFKRMLSPKSLLKREDGLTELEMAQDPASRRGSGTGRINEGFHHRRGISSRIVYDDQFGDLHSGIRAAIDTPPFPGAAVSTLDESTPPSAQALAHNPQQVSLEASPSDVDPTTLEAASASFVRALAGALYLHAGAKVVKDFHRDHILSRFLQLHTLFNFTHPTRDLSRLCLREGFEPPVARLLSETGRLSRTPVFVVGVYSGNDKLGEGVGSSLNEGRVRAAAAALRSWYLYSPPASEVMMPSDVEGASTIKWKPQMIDVGEVIT